LEGSADRLMGNLINVSQFNKSALEQSQCPVFMPIRWFTAS
jgi:hypothetical protein